MKYLPTEIAATVEQHDLIVFDGECVLCSGFCRVMLKHDRQNCFAYATAQSALGTRPNLALGLPTAFYKTNLVIVDGRLFQRLDAFCAAMRALGGGWRVLGWLRFPPCLLKNFVYHRIARNRYAIFGRHEQCMIPTDDLRARFLEGGW